MFAGAVVIRGHDWRWKDQDGRKFSVGKRATVNCILDYAGGLGMTGKIVRIIGWQNESAVSYLFFNGIIVVISSTSAFTSLICSLQ